MEEAEKQELLAKAKRLEGKLLYVKAAEIYLKLSDEKSAASTYEKGGDLSKAAGLFEKIGKKGDAERCRKKRDAAATGQTWQDMQSDFQKDSGNPY